MILFLTTQNIHENAKISEGFRGWLVGFYERIGLDSSDAWWNDKLAIRRLGHIIEYGLLGIGSGVAFYDSHNRFLKAVGLCIVISILDQTIKIFVPVRHFDFIDIGFDAIGTLIGIGIVKCTPRQGHLVFDFPFFGQRVFSWLLDFVH